MNLTQILMGSGWEGVCLMKYYYITKNLTEVLTGSGQDGVCCFFGRAASHLKDDTFIDSTHDGPINGPTPIKGRIDGPIDGTHDEFRYYGLNFDPITASDALLHSP